MSLELDRALTGLCLLERVEIDEWKIDLKTVLEKHSELFSVPSKRNKPKKIVSRKGTYQ
jgi:hypothetical protein